MADETYVAHVERIVRDAERRLADANLLAEHPRKSSDADYLLKLLAFELLLKALNSAHRGRVEKHHGYVGLFSQLPDEVQQRVKAGAAERMTIYADYSNFDELLRVFSKNFVALRYPYECYEGLSRAEYHSLGEEWLANGAREDDASFVLHPFELDGLIDSLRAELAAWLGEIGRGDAAAAL